MTTAMFVAAIASFFVIFIVWAIVEWRDMSADKQPSASDAALRRWRRCYALVLAAGIMGATAWIVFAWSLAR